MNASTSPKIPRHIAIVMDGNGRWAERRSHPRVFGHIRGSRRVKEIVRESSKLGVKALTLYTFSTENWTRPSGELAVLWKLLKRYIAREVNELDREGVRLRVIGEIERLSDDVRVPLEAAIERLSKNTGLQLNLAISYGSRRELARATQNFAKDCVAGRFKPEDFSEQLMNQYLWTQDLRDLSDVDLVIRTSGEMRTSNFLLWQAAYAEYHFVDLCWPDFLPAHLHEAILDFGRRDRRFGRLPDPRVRSTISPS